MIILQLKLIRFNTTMTQKYSSINSILVRHTHKHQPLQKKHILNKKSYKNNRLSSTMKNSHSVSSSVYQSKITETNGCHRSRCISSHRSSQRVVQQKTSLSTSKNTNQKYMKRVIDRMIKNYQQSQTVGELINQKQLKDIMIGLGFINKQPTQKEIQSTTLIMRILSRQNRGVLKRNLVKFMHIILGMTNRSNQSEDTQKQRPCCGLVKEDNQDNTNYEPLNIGFMDADGIWITTNEEQNQIKSKFGYLNYNRLSNPNVEYQQSPFFQSNYFQPHTLPNSSRMFLNHKKTMSSALNMDTSILSSREECYKLKHQEWVQNQKSIQTSRQLANCTFKPLINISSARSKYSTSIKIKNNQLKEHLTSIQLKQIQEIKQCTFRPKLTIYKQNRVVPLVKNSAKVINRIQQANKKRIALEVLRCPQNPKQSRCNISQKHDSQELQLNSLKELINEKIKDSVQNLEKHEGELFESLVCKILVKNNLPYKFLSKIQEMLERMIQSSGRAHINDGFITCK